MTICVAVKVHDCLVFAADSATSIMEIDPHGTTLISNVMKHGNKVFNLVRGLPICAMTCGMGNIGRQSISSLAKDLRCQLETEIRNGEFDVAAYTIEQMTQRAREFLFDEHYRNLPQKPDGDHSMEFFVGGYSAGVAHPEIWKIRIVNGECFGPECQATADDPATVVWSGQPEALNRLLIGYSQFLPDALLSCGLDAANLEPTMEHIRSHTATSLVEDPMPIGDAIELADFLVDTTKRYVHFLRGADTVGGATDIAAVTRHEGFKWIRRKHHYAADLNRETDHV